LEITMRLRPRRSLGRFITLVALSSLLSSGPLLAQRSDPVSLNFGEVGTLPGESFVIAAPLRIYADDLFISAGITDGSDPGFTVVEAPEARTDVNETVGVQVRVGFQATRKGPASGTLVVKLVNGSVAVPLAAELFDLQAPPSMTIRIQDRPGGLIATREIGIPGFTLKVDTEDGENTPIRKIDLRQQLGIRHGLRKSATSPIRERLLDIRDPGFVASIRERELRVADVSVRLPSLVGRHVGEPLGARKCQFVRHGVTLRPRKLVRGAEPGRFLLTLRDPMANGRDDPRIRNVRLFEARARAVLDERATLRPTRDRQIYRLAGSNRRAYDLYRKLVPNVRTIPDRFYLTGGNIHCVVGRL